MSGTRHIAEAGYTQPVATACEAVQAGFSAYLDSAMSGVEMAAMGAHMENCAACSEEFAAWRAVQQALGDIGPAVMPASLQNELRATIAAEHARGSYLPLGRRVLRSWKLTIAPAAVRIAGGFTAALTLVAGLGWLFSAPIAANDDHLANLAPPHYLYSQVPPQPIAAPRDMPIIVEARVDERGRVYDYSILEGPTDPKVALRVEANLLASVFQPATVFGAPVRGHVVVTYTGVLVRG
jgi:hypothetical protein